MKKTTLAAALLLVTGASQADTTHTMTDGRFDFVDAAGEITTAGHNDVQGTFDLVNGTGTFDTSTNFNGFPWHADVVEMDMHSTMTGGTDPSTVEANTYGWTNLSFANATFSEFYNCRVSDSGVDGCDATQTAGKNQLGAGVHNEYTYNLTAGQFAAGVFFDWSTNADIPVLAIMQVTAQNPDGSMDVISVGTSCDTTNTLCGTAMVTSPFPDQTPVFSGTLAPVSAIPVPAAVWLFGSGLIGLAGVARRRKTA